MLLEAMRHAQNKGVQSLTLVGAKTQEWIGSMPNLAPTSSSCAGGFAHRDGCVGFSRVFGDNGPPPPFIDDDGPARSFVQWCAPLQDLVL